MLTEIISFVLGGVAGMILLGIFAIDSYQKGYEDGLKEIKELVDERGK